MRPFIDWATTTYTFTNRRFIKRSGLIAKEGRTIPLNRISDVDFEIGLIDRMFGCGTLVVSDASEQGRVELNDIPHVEQVQLQGRRGAPQARRPPAPRGRWNLSLSARDELERAILGEEPAFTALEVADETGVTIDQPRRLWRALGFPEHGVEVAFTEADAERGLDPDRHRRERPDRLRHGGQPHPRGRPDHGPAGRLGGRHAGPPGRGARAGHDRHRQPHRLGAAHGRADERRRSRSC